MFTGIIQEIGLIKAKEKNPSGGFSLSIESKKMKPQPGDSISVNGACLTVSKKILGGFCADVIPETLRKTNLIHLHPDDKVNLEPSLKIGDGLDGHFVTGHVDAACKIKKIAAGGKLSIELPKKLRQFVAKKGSIAVNGVSLTVTDAGKNFFTVALVPYTLKNTNLGEAENEDFVNIEADLIARYVKNPEV